MIRGLRGRQPPQMDLTPPSRYLCSRLLISQSLLLDVSTSSPSFGRAKATGPPDIIPVTTPLLASPPPRVLTTVPADTANASSAVAEEVPAAMVQPQDPANHYTPADIATLHTAHVENGQQHMGESAHEMPARSSTGSATDTTSADRTTETTAPPAGTTLVHKRVGVLNAKKPRTMQGSLFGPGKR